MADWMRKKGPAMQVPISKQWIPRIKRVMERYKLNETEAVELGLVLASVASGETMMRVFGPKKKRSGCVGHVGDVVREMVRGVN